ncbi:SDR family NAD(P)-dependent oxidoreductase [Cohnella thermotolerans]|uniref:SDR family NAD(P)-dependent oxidoreductase n=1 Tax=Cohnella thermotolerans TaxID=329858 RepID=UPI000407F13C|nr:SDR family oxidoreductase [Cohnella thermotolerans]
MSLAGKVALVTGAGTGIGQGVAVGLAERGAKVAVSYHASASGAMETVRRIEELGGEAIIVRADVAVKAEIDAMAREVERHFGGVDILVNNAALQLNYNFEHDDDSYDRQMNVNLKGYWQCMQAVIPSMKARGSGRIVNISSVHAKRPTDFDTVYAMTKGGIKMLTREAAIELGKYGITVNAIEPGAVNVGRQGTKETRPFVPPELAERARREKRDVRWKFPLGRVGLPSDVASLVAYIVSDEAVFLTGAAIRLDGGSMLL